MSLMCMDFPRIRLSEHSISILDFKDGRLQVDYTCSPRKDVRLRVFGHARRGPKNPFQSATLRPRDWQRKAWHMGDERRLLGFNNGRAIERDLTTMARDGASRLRV